MTLVKETSQFLCYERLLNMTYVAYKKCIFLRNAILSHFYTVISYKALFRLSVYKIPAVYLSGAKMCVFARYATLVPRLYYIIPITDTTLELSVFWPSDTESRINELRFSESISLSFKTRLTSVIGFCGDVT